VGPTADMEAMAKRRDQSRECSSRKAMLFGGGCETEGNTLTH